MARGRTKVARPFSLRHGSSKLRSCTLASGHPAGKNIIHQPLPANCAQNVEPGLAPGYEPKIPTDPEAETEPGYTLLGFGACRTADQQFPEWGSGAGTNKQCAARAFASQIIFQLGGNLITINYGRRAIQKNLSHYSFSHINSQTSQISNLSILNPLKYQTSQISTLSNVNPLKCQIRWRSNMTSQTLSHGGAI